MRRLLFLEAARSPSGAMPETGKDSRGHGGYNRMTPGGNQQRRNAVTWLTMLVCTVLAVAGGIILCRMIPEFCSDFMNMLKRIGESVDWRYFQLPVY